LEVMILMTPLKYKRKFHLLKLSFVCYSNSVHSYQRKLTILRSLENMYGLTSSRSLSQVSERLRSNFWGWLYTVYTASDVIITFQKGLFKILT
jgi:hypothetical protein